MDKSQIIGLTAGVTLGFATVNFVKALIADLIIPLMVMVFVSGTGKFSKSTSHFFQQFLSSKGFRFANFTSELVTWLLIIVVVVVIYKAVERHKHPMHELQELKDRAMRQLQ
jgi:large-conductance mechanosensitive channel